MRRWLGALVLAVALALAAGGCSDPDGAPLAAGPPPLFLDRTAASGVDFIHHHCGSGKKFLVEINAGGVALLDYDVDGDLDLFFAQGAPLPGSQVEGLDLRDRLYRNDGGFRFTDVTRETGATDDDYTYSAACPDVDGDGDPDLYLCNFGAARWLRNDGGKFIDVTGELGGSSPAWSTAASFADFDQDGDLDLHVVNYLQIDFGHRGCGTLSKGPEWRSYCHPDEFPPADDVFFRNDGGRFVNATAGAGMAGRGGAGLGSVVSDYDDDGDVDLFVANDSTPNFLWRNDGGLVFQEVAAEAWVAVNGSGLPTAAMGTDFGDIDRDGDFDLIVANLAMEMVTLYRNEGQGRFEDRSTASGIGPPSLRYVGFGCEFFDADLDGDLDCTVANGHVIDNIRLYEPAQTFRQPPQFHQNDGTGRFREIGAAAGSYFAQDHVGRGLAVGDLDNDGDLDVVISHNNDRPALLENTTDGRQPWIGFELVGRDGNRQAIGARVTVLAGGRTQVEEVRGTSSYAAFHDLRLLFGLGDASGATKVVVRWPDGRTSEHGPLAAGRYWRLAAD